MTSSLMLSSGMNLGESIYPEMIQIGGVTLPLSGMIGTALVLILLLVAYFIRRSMKNWQDTPRGLQDVIELIVDTVHNFANDKVSPYADALAPFTLTFMVYILFGTCIELFGIPPITKDINCALALGLTSFVIVNVMALRVLGLHGRIKHLATPSAVVLPIKVLTDCIAPLSMTLRLFANILVGYLIMHLIYLFCPVILPGILSVYFTLLHAAIQCYVFGTLNLNYVQEALE